MEQQMNKFFGSAITLAILATPAMAHPADHSFDFLQSIAHLLTQPDHLALLGAAAVGAVAVFKFRTRKA
jgi:hydrogenase/urease accessory protein HupE